MRRSWFRFGLCATVFLLQGCTPDPTVGDAGAGAEAGEAEVDANSSGATDGGSRPDAGQDTDAGPQDPPCQGIQAIDETIVDDDVSYFATFHSHNQKVVANQHGIFLTYVPERYLIDGVGGEPIQGTWSTWHLLRSQDGGQTFSTIAMRTNVMCQTPAIDTDAQGRIFLMYTESPAHDTVAKFSRYTPDNNYSQPDRTANVTNGSGGKYALHYDPARDRLYYFVNLSNDYWLFPYPAMFKISADGADIEGIFSLLDGDTASIEYPHLSVGGNKLFAAWTNQRNDRFHYWDIHFAVSDDGGGNWRNIGGAALELPVVSDHTGPTENIVPPQEYETVTWLANMLYKDDKLHFMYMAGDAMHYIRYDVSSGVREIDLQPVWAGPQISLRSMDGFFVTDPDAYGSPLFVVARDDQGRLAILRSPDNGTTWDDYAVGRDVDHAIEQIIFVGGFRKLTPDGHIIGSYTLLTGPPGSEEGQRLSDLPSPHSKLVFFKVDACL